MITFLCVIEITVATDDKSQHNAKLGNDVFYVFNVYFQYKSLLMRWTIVSISIYTKT